MNSIVFIVLFQIIFISALAQRNEFNDSIPPNIVEPMPFYFEGCGDTLCILDSNFKTDSLFAKLWIDLLLDSLGNKLSFAIIAFDDYSLDKREVYIEYDAFDFYESNLNYYDIYPDSIIRLYSHIERFIDTISLEETGQPNNNKYYSLIFVVYIKHESKN
jgi:hypothetical protein